MSYNVKNLIAYILVAIVLPGYLLVVVLEWLDRLYCRYDSFHEWIKTVLTFGKRLWRS